MPLNPHLNPEPAGRSRFFPLLRVAGETVVIALIGNLVLGGLIGYRGWPSYVEGFWPFFCFSFCIGLLCALVLGKVWPATAQWPKWKATGTRTAALAFCVTLGTLAGQLLLFSTTGVPYAYFWHAFDRNIRISILMTLTFGVTTLIYEHYRAKSDEAKKDLARKEMDRQRALRLATEARLASLESRVHPHFLFNTLNTISALIHEDPKEADAQLQRLSKLLRFSLDAPTRGLVPLEQELQMVRDYLQIEQVRFGPKLQFSITAEPGTTQALVPPLSLQTVVENSVKYAVAPQREGATITVQVRPTGDQVSCTIHDTGPGIPAQPLPPGHGLDLLRSRLDNLFGDRAALQLQGNTVTILLPLHASELSSTERLTEPASTAVATADSRAADHRVDQHHADNHRADNHRADKHPTGSHRPEVGE